MISSKIAILLAAFNGENYLSQQVDSLLSQTIPADIYISVDPSLDNTLSIVKSYSERHPNISYFLNEIPSGSSCANFLKLLNKINLKKYDFISFSDQDDIWLPDKVERSILELSANHCEIISTSILPFSDSLYCNKYNAINLPSQAFTKYSFLLKSYGSACTIVVTTKAAKTIQRRTNFMSDEQISSLIFFDWLISAIASLDGLDWYQSSYVSIFYRQHQNNVLGASLGFRSFIKRFLFVMSDIYIQQVYLMTLVAPKDSLAGLFSSSFNKRYSALKYIIPSLFRNHGYFRPLVISLTLLFQLFRGKYS